MGLRFICWAVVILTIGGATQAAVSVTDQEIQVLIRNLGSDRFAVREEATEKLKQAGEPAASALEQAAESTDPEVRLRAQMILADIRLGITPEWSAEMIALARGFRQLPEDQQLAALKRLTETLGGKATPFLLSRATADAGGVADEAFRLIREQPGREAARQAARRIKKPGGDAGRRVLAWALGQLGRIDEALQQLGEDADPAVRHQLFENGVESLMEKLGKQAFEEAAASAEKLAGAAPQDSRFLYLQAEALDGLGRHDEAKALQEKALALQSNEEASHYTTGEMLMKMGRNRLAEREWRLILEIPPADGVYDINAYLRLSVIAAGKKDFKAAADHLQKSLDLYHLARADGQGMCLMGGDEAQMQAQIRSLRKKAVSPEPRHRKADEKEADLRLNVAIHVKDNRLNELRKAVKNAEANITMNVKPLGVRLLDLKEFVVRYDPEKKRLLTLLHDHAGAEPVPLPLKGPEARVVIHTLDCSYVYEINTATGAAEQTARFEKDYTVRVTAGRRALTLTDVEAEINGKSYDWDQLQAGVKFDYLPEKFDIKVSGADPSNKRETLRLNAASSEPGQLPPSPHEVDSPSDEGD